MLAELQMLCARRAEWRRADEAAKAQIAGLGQALDETAAKTKKLEGEVASLRSANTRLETGLQNGRAGAGGPRRARRPD